MMITIVESKILFKNPTVGQVTKAIEAHYNGRRIIAMVGDERKTFRFEKEELLFEATEEQMIEKIQQEAE